MLYEIKIKTKSGNAYQFYNGKDGNLYFRSLWTRGKVVRFVNSIMEGESFSFIYVMEKNGKYDEEDLRYAMTTKVVKIEINDVMDN